MFTFKFFAPRYFAARYFADEAAAPVAGRYFTLALLGVGN